MQTLGVSDTTPRTEGFFKGLFWPSVENATDADYIGRQGFWIGLIASVVALLGGLFLLGNVAISISAFFFAITYALCAVGVREHDLLSALGLFIIFLLNTLIRPGALGVIVTAILLTNVRAVWIAQQWRAGSEEAEKPPRLNVTWSDKLADQMPQKVWPVLRWPSYVITISALALQLIGMAVIALGALHKLP